MRLVMSRAGAVRGRRGFVLRGLSVARPGAASEREAAFMAGEARGGGVWWPELGPLNFAERAKVRRAVAERVTFACSRPAVFIEAHSGRVS